MKIENIKNTNFNGYKNIISYQTDSIGNKFIHLSGQLDNVGHPDLNIYKELMKKLGCSISDNTFSLTIMNGTHGDFCFINDKYIFPGDILKGLSNSCINDYDKISYKKIECIALKFYTLFGSITKRMANDNSEIQDKEMYKVGINAIKALDRITKDAKFANDFVLHMMRFNKPYQETAKSINNFITKTMEGFFD